MSETNGNGRAVAIPAGGKPLGIVPTNFDEVARMAKLCVMAGMFRPTKPRGDDDQPDETAAVAQATMAILQGLEIGVSPMQAVNNIAIVNGRPCVWGALIPALIWRAGHKIEERVEGEDGEMVAICTITRADNGAVIERSFSVKDAVKAGLWSPEAKIKRYNKKEKREYTIDNDSPWHKYPKRMLAMRARGYAANDGVPDVLRGMYTVEEMQDVREESRGELTAEMPPPPPPADSLADDAAFLAETVEQNQLDIEDAIALREREDAEFIGKAVAKFQTAALNATDAEEVETLFVKFEEETDGRLGEDARQMAEIVRESNIARLEG